MENSMKRTLAALLALIMIISTLCLTSCGKDDDVPEGMQLVRGGEDVGYYFYGPEEWVVANLGNISCTYVSSINLSSISFTETQMPEGTVTEYFESEKEKFPYEITVSVNGEGCAFGNADKIAAKYVYSYTYKDISYTCMQIFVEHSDRFFIFTYTANNTLSTDGETAYDRYLEKVTAVIDAFRFTDRTGDSSQEAEYERDSDGYSLVSDKTLSGFRMYVPDGYKVDYSSAMVSVSKEDGTNITMCEATYNAVDTDDYWNARKTSLEAIADKATDENGETVSTLKEIVSKEKTEAANAKVAVYYEYTYSLEGVEYHVYQVLMRKGILNNTIYVFTYTATGEAYESNFEEMKTILGKIEL